MPPVLRQVKSPLFPGRQASSRQGGGGRDNGSWYAPGPSNGPIHPMPPVSAKGSAPPAMQVWEAYPASANLPAAHPSRQVPAPDRSDPPYKFPADGFPAIEQIRFLYRSGTPPPGQDGPHGPHADAWNFGKSGPSQAFPCRLPDQIWQHAPDRCRSRYGCLQWSDCFRQHWWRSRFSAPLPGRAAELPAAVSNPYCRTKRILQYRVQLCFSTIPPLP